MTEFNTYLTIYCLIVFLLFGFWAMTMGDKRWVHTHTTLGSLLMLCIPLIPIILLLKSFIMTVKITIKKTGGKAYE